MPTPVITEVSTKMNITNMIIALNKNQVMIKWHYICYKTC